MRKQITMAVSHPLISGSAVIFLGAIFGNFFNFLFNLFMSRNLSITDYGTLSSLISLVAIAGVPGGFILPTVVNFAASHFAKGDLGMVKGLFIKINKLSFGIGFCILILFLAFTSQIGQFFNIHNNTLIVLTGVIVAFGFIGVVNLALLQAKLAFTFISVSGLVASLLKLSFGVALVMLGFSVGGVLWAILISSIGVYIISFIPLGFLFKRGTAISNTTMKSLIGYGVPTSIIQLSLTSFITSDIILVKHFFDPQSAGLYAGLSLIGRVIFFFSAPIASVMFPLIVQRYAKKENYQSVFKLSLFLVFLFSLSLTVLYFVFPQFVIKFFLKKEEYFAVSGLLGLFGVYIIVYSLLSITINFYLSVKKTIIFIPIVITALLQVLLIWFLHTNFTQVILLSLGCTSLLLIVLLLYYWGTYGKK